MELTREVITALAECTLFNCNKCKASKFCESMSHNDIEKSLASELLAELNAPKVWDGAPEWATEAWIQWRDKTGKHFDDISHALWSEKPYTRTLSRIDEIAEESVRSVFENKAPTVEVFKDAIKSAILKDREEGDGK